jgi:hypothetical protein
MQWLHLFLQLSMTGAERSLNIREMTSKLTEIIARNLKKMPRDPVCPPGSEILFSLLSRQTCLDLIYS